MDGHKIMAMSVALRDMIDNDPVSFETCLPCILAYWILKTGVTPQELSKDVNDALKEQLGNRRAEQGL